MDAGRLTVTEHDDQGRRILQLVGDLDAHTAPDLESALAPLEASDGAVVLDVSGLEFIDSAGLGVMVTFQGVHGGLTLRHPSERVAKVIEYAGLSDHLAIES